MHEIADFLQLNITLNVTPEDEHESYVKGFNHTFKQQCRMCFATLNFNKTPRRMVVELVYLQIFWINFYIPRNYISMAVGIGTIICGIAYDYNLLCGIISQLG